MSMRAVSSQVFAGQFPGWTELVVLPVRINP